MHDFCLRMLSQSLQRVSWFHTLSSYLYQGPYLLSSTCFSFEFNEENYWHKGFRRTGHRSTRTWEPKTYHSVTIHRKQVSWTCSFPETTTCKSRSVWALLVFCYHATTEKKKKKVTKSSGDSSKTHFGVEINILNILKQTCGRKDAADLLHYQRWSTLWKQSRILVG